MKLLWKDLLPIIGGALRDLNLYDHVLLQERAQERAVTHKLGEYIRDRLEKLPGYGRDPDQPLVVDCEYNRMGHGRQVKKTPCRDEELWDDGETYYTPNPDVIVHQRTVQTLNNLVIELKTDYRYHVVSVLADKMKLVGYLYEPTCYDFGLFIDLGWSDEAKAITLREAKLVDRRNVNFDHESPQATHWDYCIDLMTEVLTRDPGRRRIKRPGEVDEGEAKRQMETFERAFLFRDAGDELVKAAQAAT